MLSGAGRVEGGKDYKDIKEFLRMMSTFIAIIVLFSWACACVRTHQIVCVKNIYIHRRNVKADKGIGTWHIWCSCSGKIRKQSGMG